jgi:hypothetical protein
LQKISPHQATAIRQTNSFAKIIPQLFSTLFVGIPANSSSRWLAAFVL